MKQLSYVPEQLCWLWLGGTLHCQRDEILEHEQNT